MFLIYFFAPHMSEKKDHEVNTQKENDHIWWQGPVNMFLRLSAWVAIPVVIATFVGNWIDERNGTAPWGLISVVGIAFTISMVGLVKEAASEFKMINKDIKADQRNREDSNTSK